MIVIVVPVGVERRAPCTLRVRAAEGADTPVPVPVPVPDSGIGCIRRSREMPIDVERRVHRSLLPALDPLRRVPRLRAVRAPRDAAHQAARPGPSASRDLRDSTPPGRLSRRLPVSRPIERSSARPRGLPGPARRASWIVGHWQGQPHRPGPGRSAEAAYRPWRPRPAQLAFRLVAACLPGRLLVK